MRSSRPRCVGRSAGSNAGLVDLHLPGPWGHGGCVRASPTPSPASRRPCFSRMELSISYRIVGGAGAGPILSYPDLRSAAYRWEFNSWQISRLQQVNEQGEQYPPQWEEKGKKMYSEVLIILLFIKREAIKTLVRLPSPSHAQFIPVSKGLYVHYGTQTAFAVLTHFPPQQDHKTHFLLQ